MAYQATPLESSLSPTELLMERKIRTMVPILPSQLEPSWPYLEQFRERDSAEDTAESLPDLLPGDTFWLPCKKAGTPQSYTIATPSGQLRRNRWHLNLPPESPSNIDTTPCGEPFPCEKTDNPVCTNPLVSLRRSTRSSREIRVPECFQE